MMKKSTDGSRPPISHHDEREPASCMGQRRRPSNWLARRFPVPRRRSAVNSRAMRGSQGRRQRLCNAAKARLVAAVDRAPIPAGQGCRIMRPGMSDDPAGHYARSTWTRRRRRRRSRLRIAARRGCCIRTSPDTGDAAAFIRMKQAYDVLGDADRRAAYDRAAAAAAVAGRRPHRSRRSGSARPAAVGSAARAMGGTSAVCSAWRR